MSTGTEEEEPQAGGQAGETPKIDPGSGSRPQQKAVDSKGAAVKFPPPAIFVLLLFAGAGLHYLWPLELGVPETVQPVGFVLTISGLIIAIVVNSVFKRKGTAIEPWKPTTALVTTGLYRVSRNPIYTGFCLFNFGIGVSANSLWVLLSFIPAAILVYYIAITKEETYLEQKFGQEYLHYKAKVRRWI